MGCCSCGAADAEVVPCVLRTRPVRCAQQFGHRDISLSLNLQLPFSPQLRLDNLRARGKEEGQAHETRETTVQQRGLTFLALLRWLSTVDAPTVMQIYVNTQNL